MSSSNMCIIIKTDKELNQSEIIDEFIFAFRNDVFNKKEETNKLLQNFSRDYLDKLVFHRINDKLYLNDDEKFTEFIHNMDDPDENFKTDNINKEVKRFLHINLIYSVSLNKSSLSYNDLYGLIDINNYSVSDIILNYICEQNHKYQYVFDTYFCIEFEKNMNNLNNKCYALKFNVDDYNKVVINKIINSDLKNELNKNIICDLSTLFSKDLMVVYKNDN